jgi:hypothetical protein
MRSSRPRASKQVAAAAAIKTAAAGAESKKQAAATENPQHEKEIAKHCLEISDGLTKDGSEFAAEIAGSAMIKLAAAAVKPVPAPTTPPTPQNPAPPPAPTKPPAPAEPRPTVSGKGTGTPRAAHKTKVTTEQPPVVPPADANDDQDEQSAVEEGAAATKQAEGNVHKTLDGEEVEDENEKDGDDEYDNDILEGGEGEEEDDEKNPVMLEEAYDGTSIVQATTGNLEKALSAAAPSADQFAAAIANATAAGAPSAMVIPELNPSDPAIMAMQRAEVDRSEAAQMARELSPGVLLQLYHQVQEVHTPHIF